MTTNIPNESECKRISKFLSFVLRHHPESIGVELDENGWANVDLLIQKSNAHGVKLSIELLNHIVETNNKKRFAFNEALDQIRASQGHSVEVELGYNPQIPPEILFHGTGIKSVDSIMRSGLERRERQYVHLSRDVATAIEVGKRHGKPFVFEVLAGEMNKNNFTFYLSDNGVWLTEFVPLEYLRQPQKL